MTEIVGEDEVVRERRLLVAEGAEAGDHGDVGRVERLFIGAIAHRDAVTLEDRIEGAQARRRCAVGIDEVEGAALQDTRPSGGDVDDHQDPRGVVGVA